MVWLVLGCSDNGFSPENHGEIGDPRIQVDPGLLDFGRIGVDERGVATVTVSNVGNAGLDVTPSITGSAAFSVDPTPFHVDAGDTLSLEVAYTPLQAADVGTLVFTSTDSTHPTVDVVLNGERTAPALQIDPSDVVDFGILTTGDASEQAYTLTNTGDAPLELWSATQIGEGFAVSELEASTLAPGESTGLVVTFSPVVAGLTSEGELRVETNEPDGGASVDQIGASGMPKLEIDPQAPVDLGQIPLGCTKSQYYRLRNVGDAPLEVTPRETGDGYSVDTTTLHVLDPGDGMSVVVTFTASTQASSAGALEVSTNEPDGGQTVTQTIDVSETTHVEDLFAEPPDEVDQADLLLYIDGSGSMADDEATVAKAFDEFVADLDTHVGDWQLLVTSKASGCGELVTPSTADPGHSLDQAWSATDESESGLTTLLGAIEEADGGCDDGWLREGAPLVALLVSDEHEQSKSSWSVMVDGIQDRSPDVMIDGVVGPSSHDTCGAEYGSGYVEAAGATGGQIGSICDTDWESVLTSVALEAGGIQDRFTLSYEPDPSTIQVWVDGVTSTDWTYDDATWTIRFDAAAVPDAGSAIVVAYDLLGTC